MLLRKVLFIALLTWFSLTVLGYGIYKAMPIFLGPKIEISSPKNGEIVEGTSISVSGTLLRAKTFYINGIPTAFTEGGFFQTKLAVYPGSNILTLEVQDRFGRTISETLNIGTK